MNKTYLSGPRSCFDYEVIEDPVTTPEILDDDTPGIDYININIENANLILENENKLRS